MGSIRDRSRESANSLAPKTKTSSLFQGESTPAIRKGWGVQTLESPVKNK